TDGGASALEVPGPLIRQVVPPRPRDLIDDYTRHVGGELHAYRGVVPAHMFPQWTFPVQWRALKGVPYPLARIVNAGCALQINGPLPDDEALEVTAQLVDVDDDGYRAVLRNRVITQTA